MTKKEQMIIEAAKNIPSQYGDYKLIDTLYRAVAEIMGYKVATLHHGRWNFSNTEEHDTARKIIHGMENRGIIRISKSGQAYKMI